jgi:D-cysteine desulfhydrase
VRFHPVGSWAAVLPMLAALRARRGSYFIAPGGSSPLGSLGYVAAGLELGEQVRARQCPPPDVIYAALGSCGTVAGLLVGLRLAGLPSRVRAVQVVDGLVCNRGATLRLARRTARLLLRRGARVPPLDGQALSVEGAFYGGAYGASTPAAEEAVARAAASDLWLETTYTGKTLAALLADAATGQLDGQSVLLLDTFSSADLRPLLERAPPQSELPARLAALFAA